MRVTWGLGAARSGGDVAPLSWSGEVELVVASLSPALPTVAFREMMFASEDVSGGGSSGQVAANYSPHILTPATLVAPATTGHGGDRLGQVAPAPSPLAPAIEAISLVVLGGSLGQVAPALPSPSTVGTPPPSGLRVGAG